MNVERSLGFGEQRFAEAAEHTGDLRSRIEDGLVVLFREEAAPECIRGLHDHLVRVTRCGVNESRKSSCGRAGAPLRDSGGNGDGRVAELMGETEALILREFFSGRADQIGKGYCFVPNLQLLEGEREHGQTCITSRKGKGGNAP